MTARHVLIEGLLVLLAGAGLGLAVNAARPSGLDLGRDHFPRAPVSGSAADAAPSTRTDAADGTPAASAPPASADTAAAPAGRAPLALVGADAEAAARAEAVERLRAKGLRPIDLAGLRAFLDDPMYAYGLFVLLDARRPSDFAHGHIPGARHYDPYHPDDVDPMLLSELQAASRVVVYCNGGQCEDSETAALQLLAAGVDPGALQVYVGGIAEWTAQDLPLERDGEG